MPFEIASSVEPAMLVLRAHGVGSSSEGHRAFQAVQAHAAYIQGLPILIDRVDLEYLPTAAEGRVFAGLFATAFPCSVMALLSAPGDAQEAATEIARLAVSRGAIVAAFTCRQEAIAWLTDSAPPAPEITPEIEPAPVRARPKRLSDWVAIPYTLREKIETTRLEVEGHACPLWLDSAAGRPIIDPEVAEVTVSTEYEGFARLATVDVRVSSLDDEDYVVSVVVNAMRAVLADARGRLHASVQTT
jgi:O-methyltransferase involved in polyketide biosynthesis